MIPKKWQIRQDTRTNEFWLIKKIKLWTKMEIKYQSKPETIIRNESRYTTLPIKTRYDKNIKMFWNCYCTFESKNEWGWKIDFLKYIKTVIYRKDLNIRKLPRK